MPKRDLAGNVKLQFKSKLFKSMSYPTTKAITRIAKRAQTKQSEKKFVMSCLNQKASTDIVLQSVSTSAPVILLNGIAEGNETYQRVGRTVTPYSVEVQAQVVLGATASFDSGFVALVWDRYPSATTPNFSTIYDMSATAMSGGTICQGLGLKNNLIDRERFIILKQDDFMLSINGPEIMQWKMYVNLDKKLKGKDKICSYSGSGSTAAALQHGALYIIAANTQSDTGVATTSVAFSYSARFTFTDN